MRRVIGGSLSSKRLVRTSIFIQDECICRTAQKRVGVCVCVYARLRACERLTCLPFFDQNSLHKSISRLALHLASLYISPCFARQT